MPPFLLPACDPYTFRTDRSLFKRYKQFQSSVTVSTAASIFLGQSHGSTASRRIPTAGSGSKAGVSCRASRGHRSVRVLPNPRLKSLASVSVRKEAPQAARSGTAPKRPCVQLPPNIQAAKLYRSESVGTPS